MRATSPEAKKSADQYYIERLQYFAEAASELRSAWENLAADSVLEGHDFEGTYPFKESFEEVQMGISEWKFKAEEMLARVPAVDSPEWFEHIAAKLRADGWDAEASHTGGGIICVLVNVDGYTLWFGTANETWASFDVYDKDGYLDELSSEMALHHSIQYTLESMPCETTSIADAAKGIGAAVAIFRAEMVAKQQYRKIDLSQAVRVL